MKSGLIESAIHLRQLEFDVRLGWLEEERKSPQRVIIDFKLLFPKPPTACQTDKLGDTFCYARIIQCIKKELSAKEFKLIEHLAYTIYELLKQNVQTNEIFAAVRVTKKIPIPDFIGLGSFTYADERCAW